MESFNENVPEREKRGFFRLIDVCVHRFSKLVGLNLMYTICSLPVIAIYFLLSSVVSSALLPMQLENYDMTVTALGGMISIFLFMTLGGGPITPGFIYVIRNFCRKEHAFVVSDFFEHIKKNFKQSIVVFIIDLAVAFILLFNLNAIISTPEIFFGMHQPFAIMMGIISILYIASRMYLYPLMVTFKSPIGTIIKTSVMLCMLKLPQSVLMVLLMCVIFYIVSSLVPFVFFAFFITPLFFISFTGVMSMIYAYGVIEENVSMDDEE